tara:strand:- start:368 stop:547 length:180 start_codon:yes stop_codon:yes gene_type:complete
MRDASNYLAKLHEDLEAKKNMCDKWYSMSEDFNYWKSQEKLRSDIKIIEAKIIEASKTV